MQVVSGAGRRLDGRGWTVWLVPLLLGCQAPLAPSKQALWRVPPSGAPTAVATAAAPSRTVSEVPGRLPLDMAAPDPTGQVPHELQRVATPTYRVEPPDILLIDAVKVVPKEPYALEPLDLLQIEVEGALPERPISGIYPISASGSVDLGPPYGLIRIAGQTVSQAQQTIERQLSAVLQAPLVTVSLAEPAAKQAIIGENLVGPDGYVNLGTYGEVYVAGMTLDEVEAALEDHLSEFLEEPEISVDLLAYNSKFYYLVVQGSDQGDGVTRIPVTGNETVLDALADAGGLSASSDRRRVWIARPTPGDCQHDQILPVDYFGIVQRGDPTTNYQLLPGDRVYVAEDRVSALEGVVGRLTQPIERLFGFSLLGAQTIQTLNRFPRGFQGQQLF